MNTCRSQYLANSRESQTLCNITDSFTLNLHTFPMQSKHVESTCWPTAISTIPNPRKTAKAVKPLILTLLYVLVWICRMILYVCSCLLAYNWCYMAIRLIHILKFNREVEVHYLNNKLCPFQKQNNPIKRRRKL